MALPNQRIPFLAGVRHRTWPGDQAISTTATWHVPGVSGEMLGGRALGRFAALRSHMVAVRCRQAEHQRVTNSPESVTSVIWTGQRPGRSAISTGPTWPLRG